MPMQIKRRDRWASQACHGLLPQVLSFASRTVDSVVNATQGSKVHLHQTEHPNALPASWHCPGQHKGAVWRVYFNPARPVRFRSGMRLFRLCRFEVARKRQVFQLKTKTVRRFTICGWRGAQFIQRRRQHSHWPLTEPGTPNPWCFFHRSGATVVPQSLHEVVKAEGI